MSYSLSPYYSDFTEDELWLNDRIFHSDTLDTDKFIILLPYFILFIIIIKNLYYLRLFFS